MEGLLADARAAWDLLQTMREPASVIRRVDELCRIGSREFERHVTLRVAAPETGLGYRFVDVNNPKKGTIPRTELLEPGEYVRIGSHDAHIAAAEVMIQTRFISVWRSADVPKAREQKFTWMMREAYKKLLSVPRSTKKDARLRIKEVFEPNGTLRAVARTWGVRADQSQMELLRTLCKQLADRYLELVQVNFENGEREHDVRFVSRAEISQYDSVQGTYSPESSPRRVLFFHAPPGGMRIHLPWAKRTNHYNLTVRAPEQFFLAQDYILVARGQTTPRPYLPTRASRPKWVLGNRRGAELSLFVEGGRLERGRLFLGFANVELPGRSISRTLIIAILVTSVLLGFTILNQFFTGPQLEFAMLAVALLAISAFFSAPSLPSEIVPSPVLARMAPGALAMIALIYCFWLSSADSSWHLREHLPTTLADWIRPTGFWFRDWGGWAATIAAAAVTMVLGRARARTIREYRAVYLAEDRHSPNFYAATKQEVTA
ncbi:hypothetical protein ACPW96_19355 [Micromonospora sp. DT81.3]|uniref:hypothetical protein n=1 Tax=Micromonospora sp. DT81.3 TaxID=3416523 RepID=UPI003CFB9C70